MTGRVFQWHTQNDDLWSLAEKLRRSDTQVDVYLIVGGEQSPLKTQDGNAKINMEYHKEGRSKHVFPAHKLILAAASPFLKMVLQNHYTEHREACSTILLPEVSHVIFRYILTFIYTGSISISDQIQAEVLHVAKMLQIQSLVSYYEPDFLIKDEHQIGSAVKHDIVLSRYNFKVPPKKRGQRKRQNRDNSEWKLDGDESKVVRFSGIKESSFEDVVEKKRVLGKRKIKSRFNSDIYEYNIPILRSHNEDEKRLEEIKIDSDKEGGSKCTKQEEMLNEVRCKLLQAKEEFEDEIVVEKKEFEEEAEDNLNYEFSPAMDLSFHKEATESNFACSSDLVSRPSDLMMPLKPSTPAPTVLSLPSPIHLSEQLWHSTSSSQLTRLPTRRQSEQTSSCGLSSIKIASSAVQGILENATSSPKTQIAGEGDEDDEEDGLFKLQVLLKECEEFPVGGAASDEVLHVGSEGEMSIKYDGNEGDGVDINKWISEEIHNYMTPKGQDPLETDGREEKPSTSFCEAVVGNKGMVPKECAERLTEEKAWPRNSCTDQALSQQRDCEEQTDVPPESSEVVDDPGERKLGSTPQDSEKYVCGKCNKTYTSQKSYSFHTKFVHREAKHKCYYCEKLFKRRCDLYTHERRHANRSCICQICDKNFKLKKDLHAHMTIHKRTKVFKCRICEKELTSYRNLRNHIANVHQKERPHMCKLCQKTYTKASSLQVHIRSVHTGERPFSCETCGKSFSDKALLRLHGVTHTGEKKYSCKVCEKSFSQYSNVMSHQRVHSNVRPFLCLVCKEGFKTREALKKHKWIHTGLKPLRCKYCGKDYRVKEGYERHMLKCHGEEVHLPDILFDVSDDATPDDVQKTITSTVQLLPTDDVHLSTYPIFQNESHVVEDVGTGIQELSKQMTVVVENLRTEGISIQNVIKGQAMERSPLTISTEAVVLAQDTNTADMITPVTPSILESDGETLILSKAQIGENVEETSLPSSSRFKLWVPGSSLVGNSTSTREGNANILVLSDQNFTNAAHAFASPGSQVMSPQLVHRMVVNKTASSLCEINISENERINVMENG